MSILTPPEPANWPVGRRRLMGLSLGLGVFIGLGVFFGTRNLLRGDHLAAFVVYGIQVPPLLVLVGLRLVARGRTTLRASHDSTGTKLKPDRTFSALMLVAVGAVIPVGIVFVRYTLTGDLDMFTSRQGRVGALILMTSATTGAVAGLLSAVARGVGYVKLTAKGFDVANIAFTKSHSWADVVDVADWTETKKTRKAIVFRLRDGSEAIIDGADFYVPKGAGLYWMVRHYWRHPDDRTELVDGRALDRLRDGRFDLS